MKANKANNIKEYRLLALNCHSHLITSDRYRLESRANISPVTRIYSALQKCVHVFFLSSLI